MLVKAFASAVYGINAAIITVEVSVSKGINFFLVGLPDNAVKESKQRMETAIKSLGYKWPGKRIVINMAPADIRKEGSAYDVPLAIGILEASEQLKPDKLADYIIMGELSLDGTIHPIKGALPIAIEARKHGYKGLILPKENAREAAVVDRLDVYGVDKLTEVIDFFNDKNSLS
jgi:magnesium chelatase family protein